MRLEHMNEIRINGSVPVRVVARVYGKDQSWVRAGIVCGWLPIGVATRNNKPVRSMDEMSSKGNSFIDHIYKEMEEWEII